MVLKRITEYLDSQGVRYTIVTHSPAFTAQEIAMTAHIPNRELAKTVIVKVDDRMVMVVLPASEMVDFKALKKELGATRVELASEEEFRTLFGDCELGAMPPFGNLYNVELVVASHLAEDEEIAFNAGTHRDLMKLAFKDFERLVHPRLAGIGTRRRVHEEDEWDRR